MGTREEGAAALREGSQPPPRSRWEGSRGDEDPTHLDDVTAPGVLTRPPEPPRLTERSRAGHWSRAVAAAAGAIVLAAGCSPSAKPAAAPPTISAAATRPAAVPAPAAADRSANPYFAANFSVRTNPVAYGQDPTWTPDGRVLSNDPDANQVAQIYLQDLGGQHRSCLTCGKEGPNAFPQANPKRDWVLYGSWRGQKTTIGSPALGGTGTNFYVVRRDGSHDTALTQIAQSPADHAEDNYHPYWSPDGRQLVWTHENFLPLAQGGTKWEIRIADFLDDGGTPRLVNVRAVGPTDAAGYETQAWSPDGSGFLFTRFGDRAHFGFMNAELYFMRIRGEGASVEHPVISHLTDGSPAWDEQAVFTPDGRNVIWMSSRYQPSWSQSVVSAAQWLGFDTAHDPSIFGAYFFRLLADPQFTTELSILDLRTHAIRRLTYDHTAIPEFQFDPSGTRLLWSVGNANLTRVGTFDLGTTAGTVTGSPGTLPATLPPSRRTKAAPRGLTPGVLEGPALLAADMKRLEQLIATRITS
ncbi:MAG: Tol-Pal system beta propeller repeat protein TolB [Acidimicrobiales bacterium]|nr:Tol-Pal system beta propeller repeat protein TolB [Acidimicrobiales bacterium]